jgi:hypothetical protein
MRIGLPGTGRVVCHPGRSSPGPEHEVLADPDTMDKDTAELAYRRGPASTSCCCGTGANGELTVSVTDAASRRFVRAAHRSRRALTASNHPYAYAAVKGVT